MRKLLIRVLTRLKIIHGGHIEVVIEDDNPLWFFGRHICHKCNSAFDIMFDEEFEEGDMYAMLCGEPFKLYDQHCYYDDRSLCHWDGRILWYDASPPS